MRNGTANRRSRSRNNNNNRAKGGGNSRTQVYDSNGPEVRIRGTAFQIYEKYETLAKDARAMGDMVLAESYLQHAEHYQRIISTINAQQAAYNAENNQSQTSNEEMNDEASNDDLSLPTSILGDSVKVNSQNVRALEDA